MIASLLRIQGHVQGRSPSYAGSLTRSIVRGHRSSCLPFAKSHVVSQRLTGRHSLLSARITRWSSFPSTPAKLRELCTVGLNDHHRLRHSSYLRRELCVRLAQSAAQLQCLPNGWAEQGSFRKIIDLHGDLIQALEGVTCPANAAQDANFAEVLNNVFKDLKAVGKVSNTLKGLHALISDVNDQATSISAQVNKVLVPFFTLMTGMQFLIQHYVESRQGRRFGYSGILQLHCCPAVIARSAALDSAALCKDSLGLAPKIVVEGDVGATTTYVPAVLSYILTEVFKNSCRAVVERQKELHTALPPVKCHIESDEDGLVVTITDSGGGMSKQQLERMWDFMYTTCEQSPWACNDTPLRDASSGKFRPRVLAGYGVGLSLSRLYAQYFGGDLVASSQEGVGTEVRLHLSHSAVVEEGLPANFLFDLPLSRKPLKEQPGMMKR